MLKKLSAYQLSPETVGGPQCRCECCSKDNKLFLFPGIEPGRPAHIASFYGLSSPRSNSIKIMLESCYYLESCTIFSEAVFLIRTIFLVKQNTSS
jgi:hypothetical protein